MANFRRRPLCARRGAGPQTVRAHHDALAIGLQNQHSVRGGTTAGTTAGTDAGGRRHDDRRHNRNGVGSIGVGTAGAESVSGSCGAEPALGQTLDGLARKRQVQGLTARPRWTPRRSTILGHANIAVTLGVCSEVFDTEIATALDRINYALGGRPNPEPIDEAMDRSSNARDGGSSAEES